MLSALLPFLLAACATVPVAEPEVPTTVAPADITTETSSTEPTATLLNPSAAPLAEAKPEEPQYGNFPEDVLSRAILAELAGQRGNTQQSLDEYVALAHETGDLNIIKRT
ncbi:MAG: hypothetical protein ACTS5G_04565, partial [Burkholderiales bacterium]